MDAKELKRREKLIDEVGWDECGATGAGHSPDYRAVDGVFYCQYCGAELMPEEQEQIRESGLGQ